MTRYITGRLVGIAPSILLLVFVVVVLVRLIPGDTVDAMMGDFRASNVERKELEDRLGLGDPLVIEYTDYLKGLVRGDLGRSLWNRQPVDEIIRDKLWVTLELTLFAAIIGVTSGVLLGVMSGIRQESAVDYALRSVSIVFMSVPTFVLGSAVILIPAIYWGWTPPLFYKHFTADPSGHLKHMLLPAIVLGLPLSASLMRITRTALLEVLRQDYIRTAHAKGLRESRVVFRHALRNAFIPVITVIGLQVALLLSGSVIVESLFGIPGLGLLVFDSLNQRDYPLIEGITVILGIFVMLVNLCVDVSYVFIDPRIREGGAGGAR